MSWGPCGWWVPMEVLPTNLRAKGAALSTSFTFLYNLCVSKTTPLLFVAIGYKTYFYYAGLCALSTLITLFFLPETKGLTLEELDTLFQEAPVLVWFGTYRVDTAGLRARARAEIAELEDDVADQEPDHVEGYPEKGLRQ